MRTSSLGGHGEHSQEERGGERQEITVEHMLGAQPAHGGCAGSQELSREVLAVERGAGPRPGPQGAPCPGRTDVRNNTVGQGGRAASRLELEAMQWVRRVRSRSPKRLQEGVL